MSKTEIEEIKLNFSRFCTRLLRDYNTPKGKRRQVLSNKVIEVTNQLIMLGASDKSFHYINKCYVLTMRKLQ